MRDLQRKPRHKIWEAKSITVYQSGVTHYSEGELVAYPHVRLSTASRWTNQYDEGEEIKISLNHPSKGGGTTHLVMYIPENMFEMICEVMFEASPNAAKQAFLSLLTKEAEFLDRRKSKKTIRKSQRSRR
jgi:hypothetical protein